MWRNLTLQESQLCLFAQVFSMPDSLSSEGVPPVVLIGGAVGGLLPLHLGQPKRKIDTRAFEALGSYGPD
jgi:hypothetical protein